MYSIIIFVLLGLAALILIRPPIKALFKRRVKLDLGKSILEQKRARIVQQKQSVFTKHKLNVMREAEAAGISLTWKRYLQILAGLCVAGLLSGALLNNVILSIAMAVAFPCIPYQYLKISGVGYNRFLHTQIEDGLGIVTNSYMQSGDLRGAIESCLNRMDLPLKKIFADCSNEIYLGENVAEAIRRMRSRVDNRYWRDWCDVLIQCQRDRTLKVLLPPIISQLADMRVIQAELDTVMQSVWQEHITISLIVAASVPLIRLLNADWYVLLTTTTMGRTIVAITYLAIFVATVIVLRINRPVSMEV